MISYPRNKPSKSWNSTISRYDHFESVNYFKSNKPMPVTSRKMESLITLFITGRWLKIAIFQEKLFFRRRQFSAETETETFRWQENCSNYFVPKKSVEFNKTWFRPGKRRQRQRRWRNDGKNDESKRNDDNFDDDSANRNSDNGFLML